MAIAIKRDLYSEVTSRILAELESGAAPWIKPWSATPGQNVPALHSETACVLAGRMQSLTSNHERDATWSRLLTAYSKPRSTQVWAQRSWS
jgi:hypothetical protein